jgi:hypothetical protein
MTQLVKQNGLKNDYTCELWLYVWLINK